MALYVFLDNKIHISYLTWFSFISFVNGGIIPVVPLYKYSNAPLAVLLLRYTYNPDKQRVSRLCDIGYSEHRNLHTSTLQTMK